MNCLAHHGIKGQKWGVRNGPPYPIEDNVMKKGTRLKTVSKWSRPEDTKGWLYTYNSGDEWDSKVYEGPFAYYLKAGRGYTTLAIHEFETAKDLKMPTLNERKDGLKKVWDNADYSTKKQYVREVTKFKDQMARENWGMDKEANKKLPKLNINKPKLSDISKEDFDLFYYAFNSMMEQSDAYKLTRDYKKEMSSNFDAMVDDNNVNVYNRAHDPVIIFKTQEALKRIGDYEILPNSEIIKKHDEVAEELKKYGERVKY